MPNFGEYGVDVKQNADQWWEVVVSREGEILRASGSERCLALYNAERALDEMLNKLCDALNWLYNERKCEFNAVIEMQERERCRPATASVAR